MSTIKISDLHPTGSDLFSDSEGYMSDLSDSELNIINGASLIAISVRVTVVATIALTTLLVSPNPPKAY